MFKHSHLISSALLLFTNLVFTTAQAANDSTRLVNQVTDEIAVMQSGQVKTHFLNSQILKDNLLDISNKRELQIYLPANYNKSKQHYPVIYFIPNSKQDIDKTLQASLNKAIGQGKLKPSIFVTADFSIAKSLNFFGNNKVSGRWLDHIKNEIVPFIDNNYRTIKKAQARGIAGHFLGGNAAMKLAMFNPDIFSSVYTMHPVGTDVGDSQILKMGDWKQMHEAKSFDELTGFSAPFMAMAQAYLPNAKRPPFYADSLADLVDDKAVANVKNIRKLQKAFHIAELIPEYAGNLQQLKGFMYDWGRNDSNADHVYGNQKLSRLLTNYGIKHEALEHIGTGWDYKYDETGRFYNYLLPFFNQHLASEK